ncbi:MAG: hypothetical protein NTX40_04570, partial [Planctomycetota bacterium]|nr:hypothetical protein [Planctomycetota bacterium]
VAGRADVVRALCVARMEGTDASGATKPLAAWAAEWKASEDSATAYAGRSLAWWADRRQEGDGTWILVFTGLTPAPLRSIIEGWVGLSRPDGS